MKIEEVIFAVPDQDGRRCTGDPVSYTHLDVYKRQDPIREELVTSLISYIGPKPNVLDVNDVEQTRRIEVSQPVLTDAEMRKLLSISDYTSGKVRSKVIDITSVSYTHLVKQAGGNLSVKLLWLTCWSELCQGDLDMTKDLPVLNAAWNQFALEATRKYAAKAGQ